VVPSRIIIVVILVASGFMLTHNQALAFDSYHEKVEALSVISTVPSPSARLELKQNILVGNIATMEELRAAVKRFGAEFSPGDAVSSGDEGFYVERNGGADGEPLSEAGRAAGYSAVVTVPDEGFRYYLVNEPCGHHDMTSGVTDNGDGTVTVADIRRITHINLLPRQYWKYSEHPVTDLTGINAFSYLESLYCGRNGITSLDVTDCYNLKVLVCQHELASLDVLGCSALRDLYLYHTDITELDLNHNTELTYLHLENNPHLETVVLRYNTDLEWLFCHHNPVLNSLDVSYNTGLEKLYCENAPNLSLIYVWLKTETHEDQEFPINRDWLEVETRLDRHIRLEKVERYY